MATPLFFCVTVMAGERRICGPNWKEIERGKTLIDLFVQTYGTRILGQEVQVLVSKDQNFLEAAVVQISSPLVTLQQNGQSHIQFVLKSHSWSPALIATLKEGLLKYPAERDASTDFLRPEANHAHERKRTSPTSLSPTSSDWADRFFKERSNMEITRHSFLDSAKTVDNNSVPRVPSESMPKEAISYPLRSGLAWPASSPQCRLSFENMTVEEICAEIKRIKATHLGHRVSSWTSESTSHNSSSEGCEDRSIPSQALKNGEISCNIAISDSRTAASIDGEACEQFPDKTSVDSAGPMLNASGTRSVSRLTQSARNKIRAPVKTSSRLLREPQRKVNTRSSLAAPTLVRTRTTVIARTKRGDSVCLQGDPAVKSAESVKKSLPDASQVSHTRSVRKSVKNAKDVAVSRPRAVQKISSCRNVETASSRVKVPKQVKQANVTGNQKGRSPNKGADLFVEIYVPEGKHRLEARSNPLESETKDPAEAMATTPRQSVDCATTPQSSSTNPPSTSSECGNSKSDSVSEVRSSQCRLYAEPCTNASDDSHQSIKEFSSDSLLNQSDMPVATSASTCQGKVYPRHDVASIQRCDVISKSTVNNPVDSDDGENPGGISPHTDIPSGSESDDSEEKTLFAAKEILKVRESVSLDSVLNNYLSKTVGQHTRSPCRSKSSNFFAPLLEKAHVLYSSGNSVEFQIDCSANSSPKHNVSPLAKAISKTNLGPEDSLTVEDGMTRNLKNRREDQKTIRLKSCQDSNLRKSTANSVPPKLRADAANLSTGNDHSREALNRTFTFDLDDRMRSNDSNGDCQSKATEHEKVFENTEVENGFQSRRQWVKDFKGMDDLVMDSLLIFTRDLRCTAENAAINVRKLYDCWLTNAEGVVDVANLPPAAKCLQSPGPTLRLTRQESITQILRNMRGIEVRLKTIEQASLAMVSHGDQERDRMSKGMRSTASRPAEENRLNGVS